MLMKEALMPVQSKPKNALSYTYNHSDAAEQVHSMKDTRKRDAEANHLHDQAKGVNADNAMVSTTATPKTK